MYSKFLNKNTLSLAIFWYFYKSMLLLTHSSDQIVPVPLKKYLILSNQRFKWSIDFSYFNVLKFCNFYPFEIDLNLIAHVFPSCLLDFVQFPTFLCYSDCSWLLSKCSESPHTICSHSFMLKTVKVK